MYICVANVFFVHFDKWDFNLGSNPNFNLLLSGSMNFMVHKIHNSSQKTGGEYVALIYKIQHFYILSYSKKSYLKKELKKNFKHCFSAPL